MKEVRQLTIPNPAADRGGDVRTVRRPVGVDKLAWCESRNDWSGLRGGNGGRGGTQF